MEYQPRWKKTTSMTLFLMPHVSQSYVQTPHFKSTTEQIQSKQM
jgi:hypothetical protein